MINRAGKFIKNLSGELAYNSFLPSPLPSRRQISIDDELLNLLIKANAQIVLLNSLSKYIPNISLFVSMYVKKEAVLSSQIEGTQATLEDIFDPAIARNANNDVKEVINYIKAFDYAVKRMQKLPLSNRLIRETHNVLMKGGRGLEKTPGEFRTSQNWIGAKGAGLKNAAYIPPNPQDMKEAMFALEKYMNAQDDCDVLIRAGLIHYQFETIHPFLDGNGRLGRLLIILFLISSGVLGSPALYISYFLKNNRIEYYDRMTEVRNKGNYEQWLKFFVKAVFESAKDAVENIEKLNALRNKNFEIVKNLGRSSKTAALLFEYIEKNPIINIVKTAKALDTTFITAAQAIDKLCKKKILVKMSGGLRNKTYSYKEYLEILNPEN